MRLAVIGARQRHHGIGAHLARFCVEAGADVAAVYGTSPETAREAADQLEASTGVRAAALSDPDEVFALPGLEGLVIASPAETHADWVRRAGEARLHVLCEKPFVWGGPYPGKEAFLLWKEFGYSRLVRINEQWVFTLRTYEELIGPIAKRPATFFMRLSPSSRGKDMLVESLSHPLSLLYATVHPSAAAAGHVEAPVVHRDDDKADVRFEYQVKGHRTRCHVELVHCPDPPRPAAYGFDGRIARRHVDLSDYSFELEWEGRRVRLPDPTPLLVRAFLRGVAAGPPHPAAPGAVIGVEHLAVIMRAAGEPVSTLTPAGGDPTSP